MNQYVASLIATLAALVLITPSVAQKSSEADTLLAAAQQKETLEGDPSAAIKQYSAIVAKYAKTDRAATAMALVHMAECYQKLGDTQARSIFQRVIDEYGDQADAVATARARLGAGQSVEVIDGGGWSGPSPDGRYIGRPTQSGFVVRDLSTNADRTTPLTAGGVIRRYLVTSGGRQILYYWRKEIKPANVPAELRIINTDGTGLRTLIPARDYFELEASSVTPDGKVAAVDLERNDGKTWDMALLTLETGQLQVLKTFRDVFVGNFSPDGRWLAYEALPDASDSKDASVYTIATDGSGTVNVLASSAKLGRPFFTPDGSQVAYLVTGEGQDHVDLWSVKTANGRRTGDPELARARVVDGAAFIPKDMQPGAFGMGFDSSGAYYLSIRRVTSALYVGGIDPETGRRTQVRISDPDRRPFVAQPRWSPDGNLLAYVSNIAEAVIVIRNVKSGEEREIQTGVTTMNLIGWRPDGKSLEVTGPLIGHVLINVETGARTAAPPGGPVQASSAAPDQQDTRPGGGQIAVVLEDQPQQQTLIFRGLFRK